MENVERLGLIFVSFCGFLFFFVRFDSVAGVGAIGARNVLCFGEDMPRRWGCVVLRDQEQLCL